MAEVKPVRLIKAAKTLNVGTGTIVDHLSEKGFEVENKPTTQLTAEMYELLLKEFRTDVNLKEEAEQVELGMRRRESVAAEEEEAKPEEKKEEEVETAKVELGGLKVVDKIDLDADKKKAAAKKEAEEQAKKEADEAAKKKADDEAAAEEAEKKAAAAKKKEEPKEDMIETKKVNLEGPKIMGKIELPAKEERKKKESDDDGDGNKRRRRKRIVKSNKVDTNKPGAGNRNRGKKQDEPQTVSEKEIEEKIKATMAKLSGGGGKTRQKLRRAKRQEIAETAREEQEAQEAQEKVLQVTEFISVSELASMTDKSATEIISICMGLGVIVSINQRLDAEIIELVADELGYEVEFISTSEKDDTEDIIEEDPDKLQGRAPIVTIMGHVDHGKTSLLDYIREANVASGEAGGITQHIGAYEVKTEDGKSVSFLDTPGHEAFTAMRARGAKLTDIAVIVIAADDQVMPQTKEAISHAQSAGVPMIFAINKMDKDGADPEKIKGQLAEMNILVEDWGGKFQSQELSAKTGENVGELLEKILLEAEILELKANPDREAHGVIIEASLDKGRGYVATALVQTGTLEIGDMMVSGSYFGKVKAMYDHLGKKHKEAGPATPVQILGLNGAPQAGEKFRVYDSEQDAKQVAAKRGQIEREQGIRAQKHITLDEIGRRLALGTFKELNVILKGDVDGSVEALADSLQKLSTEEVQVNVLHRAVGQITESDVLLASASDAIIVGFQVRPSLKARQLADAENIEMRLYSVIYQAIDEVKAAMEGLLEPTIEEQVLGNIEIRETFKISGVGTIAGCYVMDGKITRNAKIRLVREGIVVYTGELESLKRFKDDVKEVARGMECGLNISNFNDIKVGDVIEAYEEVEVQRKL